jgi:hypothetical protein
MQGCVLHTLQARVVLSYFTRKMLVVLRICFTEIL